MHIYIPAWTDFHVIKLSCTFIHGVFRACFNIHAIVHFEFSFPCSCFGVDILMHAFIHMVSPPAWEQTASNESLSLGMWGHPYCLAQPHSQAHRHFPQSKKLVGLGMRLVLPQSGNKSGPTSSNTKLPILFHVHTSLHGVRIRHIHIYRRTCIIHCIILYSCHAYCFHVQAEPGQPDQLER